MKKTLKIVFINLFLIFLIIAFVELCLFACLFIQRREIKSVLGEFYVDGVYNYRNILRSTSGVEYNNKNIMIFGCSYAWGWFLKQENTIGEVLSKYTKNTVYNFSVVGGSMKDMLYLLRQKSILNEKINKKDIDYIIYVYIPHHRNRLFYDLNANSPLFIYDKKSNCLKNKKVRKGYKFFFIRKIKDYYAHNIIIKDETKMNKLKNVYFSQINKEIKKYFSYQKTPPKFIILVYEDDDDNWSELEKQGITVVKAEDLIEDINTNTIMYRLPDDIGHPNAKAWRDLIPKFVERANISRF